MYAKFHVTRKLILNIQVYVEGILIGDCVCEKMQIRYAGCVTGNLQCASLGMDPSVVLKVRVEGGIELNVCLLCRLRGFPCT